MAVRNADEAFVLTLTNVMASGSEVAATDSLSTGSRKAFKEVMNYETTLEAPRERLIHHPLRKLNLPAAVARFVWMMAGSDRLHDIAFYEEKVRFFSDDGISVPGSNYGQRILQPRPGLNQLKAVIERLREDPGSRRAAISIYHPEDAVRQSRDIPCTFGLFYLIRDSRLHSTTVMRSNNAVLLLPYNIFEFSLLAEVVATELAIDMGTLTHMGVSMHIYQPDYERAAEIVRAGVPAMGPQPSPMPRNPSPMSQVRELVILEAAVRHAAAGIGRGNIEEWIARGPSKLHPYWQQLYFLLLLHIVAKIRDKVLLDALRGVLDEPWLSYIPSDTFDALSPQATDAATLFQQAELPPEIIPVFSTKRLESLKVRSAEWEQTMGQQVSWRVYSSLQDHFLRKFAARDHDQEISRDEFNDALKQISKP